MAPLDGTDPPGAHYQRRCDALVRELVAHEQAYLRIAYGRFAAFAIGLLAVFAAFWWTPHLRAWLLPAAGLAALAFFALIVGHARVDERREHARARLAFNRESLAAIRRAWTELSPAAAPAGEDHPYAIDLDLAGEASLFQLLDRGATPLGRATLQRWLLAAAAPGEIGARQAAVRALAPDAAFREDLVAWARLLDADPQELDRFLAWAEGAVWLLRRPLLLWGTRLLTVASLSLIAVRGIEVWRDPAWIAIAAIAGILTGASRHRLSEAFDRASSGGDMLHRYARLLARVERLQAGAPLIASLQEALRSNGVPASVAVRRLARAADWSNLRRSAALFYGLIQAATLWDFHVLAILETWQRHHGRHVRGWLEALAATETLTAFGGLLHDNPSFTFPEVAGSGVPLFEARALGHPLLAGDARVVNDLSIGPPGTFLLVTGSNMSGKSTLLRAIGVNSVLALAGAPVCAASLRLSCVRVHTSMRVHDSLAQGVSYFMAALTRLKAIVEASRAGDPPLLYLLDEILQGTNSAERQVAVRRIIGFLLDRRAIGAVTTHDLELANAEPIASAARMVHFSESFRTVDGRETMHFDYVLREGVATSRNALKLMEMIGLGRDAGT